MGGTMRVDSGGPAMSTNSCRQQFWGSRVKSGAGCTPRRGAGGSGWQLAVATVLWLSATNTAANQALSPKEIAESVVVGDADAHRPRRTEG